MNRTFERSYESEAAGNASVVCPFTKKNAICLVVAENVVGQARIRGYQPTTGHSGANANGSRKLRRKSYEIETNLQHSQHSRCAVSTIVVHKQMIRDQTLVVDALHMVLRRRKRQKGHCKKSRLRF